MPRLRRHGTVAATASLVIVAFAALAVIGGIDRLDQRLRTQQAVSEAAAQVLAPLIAATGTALGAAAGPPHGPMAVPLLQGAWPFVALAVIGISALLTLLALLTAR
ncbi:MAG: hypothetical protein JO032_21075, partial [Alphaproteobacteria bacterium]|nr:hypothetical protein [Alphaproteobacteria bacterium]